MSTWRWRAAFLAAGTIALGACSTQKTVPLDTMAMSEAEQAIQRAAEADAEQHSPLELRKARDKLAAARAAADDGDYDEAVALAEQAEVDARLAEVRSEAAAAKKTSDETQRNIKALSDEAARSGAAQTR